MSNIALDIISMVIGCALAIAILIAALTWRKLKLKKEVTKDKDFVAMRLYGEHVRAERERQSNKPDRFLRVMQDVFAEMKKRDEKNS